MLYNVGLAQACPIYFSQVYTFLCTNSFFHRLEWNIIGDSGATALAEALGVNQSLKALQYVVVKLCACTLVRHFTDHFNVFSACLYISGYLPCSQCHGGKLASFPDRSSSFDLQYGKTEWEPVLHTASDQNWRQKRPGNKASGKF